jgi:DDE superfamily endonuclease
MPTSPTGSDTEDHAADDALASCIGDTGRFVREHWARAPLYRPGADGAAFADLFSLGDVDHILSSTTPRYPAFRMVREGRQLDRRSSTRSGRVGGQPVDDLADPRRVHELFHRDEHEGLAISTIHGDLLWLDGGWPGSCHEHELIKLAGLDHLLDEVEVASLLDRGSRGLAKARAHWHVPVGDRRIKDRLSDAQRAFNRLQAGLRALVEQSIAHLANAWALRRWRGLLYRVRNVFRAAGALICLRRWLHRVPHEQPSRTPQS